MQLEGEKTPGDGNSPENEVVLSCRVRLARNFAGFPFVNRASNSQCQEIVSLARKVFGRVDELGELMWLPMQHATELDRNLLVERHLISKPFAGADIPRAVGVSDDESFSIMVNEEDHLRIQCIANGLQLEQVHARIDSVDDGLEERVDFAFDQRWGYLTACPTNVGTGIRFSVMMHLPAMKITNEIERLRRAARDLHLAVRGYYGEGSESDGDFYQISNQITLGRTESELLEQFEHRIVPRIIEYERRARQMLLDKKRALLEDRVHRAHGILRNARLLGPEEAMKLLSRLRLGVYMGLLEGVEKPVVNRLFLDVQDAHLKQKLGDDLSKESLRAARAAAVRKALA